MMNTLLDILKEQFTLKEIAVGEYQKLKAKGMTFSIRQFYAEGLLANGGPSTDVFKKQFGDEKTAELFRKVLFGV